MSKITTQEYWENYYKKQQQPKKDVIINVCSNYDVFFDCLIKNNPNNHPKTIIEVGGYPGRYLAYLSNKYNIIPTSFDFNPDKSAIEQNMKSFDVKDFSIIQGDFVNYVSNIKYDFVFSHGFIEHFSNFEIIMDNHVSLLKTGGTMMITVPNKRNFRFWYGMLLDKENLKQHNTKCMKKSVFLDFAKRNHLELLKFEYFGGFPYTVHQKLNVVQRVIYKITSTFFKLTNPFLKKHPNRFTCSLLICIVRKNG